MSRTLKGLYTRAGIAELLNMQQSTILRAIRAGTLRCYVTACGKSELLKMKDVKEWREKFPVGRPEGSKGKKKTSV